MRRPHTLAGRRQGRMARRRSRTHELLHEAAHEAGRSAPQRSPTTRPTYRWRPPRARRRRNQSSHWRPSLLRRSRESRVAMSSAENRRGRRRSKDAKTQRCQGECGVWAAKVKEGFARFRCRFGLSRPTPTPGGRRRRPARWQVMEGGEGGTAAPPCEARRARRGSAVDEPSMLITAASKPGGRMAPGAPSHQFKLRSWSVDGTN